MASILNLFIPPDEEDVNNNNQVPESESSEMNDITTIESVDEDTMQEIAVENSSEIEIPGTILEGPVYANPDHNDPGFAFPSASEDDYSSELQKPLEPPSSPNDNRRKSILNIFFKDDISSDSESDDIKKDSKYTFTNTVVGSYRDDLAEDMKREVEER